MNNKKICFLTELPIESEGGASLRVFYEYINYFLKERYDVYYIALTPSIKKPKLIWSIKKKKLKPKSFFIKCNQQLIPNRFGLINKLDKTNKIKEILKKNKIKLVVAFDVVMASQIYKIKNVKKIAWLGDLRFDTNFYNFFYNLRNNIKLIKNFPFIIVQNFLLKKEYKSILLKMDETIVSSLSSVRKLSKINVFSKFLAYPWPKTIGDIKKHNLADTPTFLFFGNLSGLGSKSSIYELLFKIYPLLKKKMGKGNFKILIGGINFDKSLFKQYDLKKFEGIKFIGFIKKIEQIAEMCVGVIFPGNVPVGNRCRLISCLSAKILVIAHKSCTLGNPYLIDGKTALIAKNPKEFVKKMQFANENIHECEKIKTNGKIVYEKYFNPNEACKYFEKIINEKNS